MSYRNLPEASEEQSQQFVREARSFIEDNGYYSSYKGVAVTAVADYIASTNGLQLLRVKKLC